MLDKEKLVQELIKLWEVKNVTFIHLKEYSSYNYNYYLVSWIDIWEYNVIHVVWQDDDFQPRTVKLWKLNWKTTTVEKNRMNWKEYSVTRNNFDELWYLYPEDYSEWNILSLETLSTDNKWC